MDLLKTALIASALLFLYLLLKSGLWRRIPFLSAIVSVALFIGIILLGFFIGSILIFVLLGIIAFAIILFIIFWIFGRARIYRLTGKSVIINPKKPKKKPKVTVLK